MNFLSGQAFLLHAQQHDYIRAAQRFFDVARDMESRSQRNRKFRYELGRAAEGYFHSQLAQQMAGGAGYAAVRDISNDRDTQVFKGFFMFQNREGVEQGL